MTPCHTIESVDVQLTQQAIMPGVTNLGGCSSEPHNTVKNKRKAAGKRGSLFYSIYIIIAFPSCLSVKPGVVAEDILGKYKELT